MLLPSCLLLAGFGALAQFLEKVGSLQWHVSSKLDNWRRNKKNEVTNRTDRTWRSRSVGRVGGVANSSGMEA